MYTGSSQPQPRQPAAPPEPLGGPNKGSSDEFAPGQIIEGRYKVISLLGMGGMGAVYLVEQILLHKHYALKILSSDKVTEKNIMRFQKEAQAAGALDHPGLTRVHDFGLVNQRVPFFVMDYIQGESLSDRIMRGPLSVDEAVPILIKAALALGHAHDKGIIHRDLKPSNIMLTRDENGERAVKIVDFGIAKFIYGDSDDVQALTKTGEIFGSPFYMSPEQCMGLAVDNRSDIYSFGCLMFETLTGNPPFLGDTALATMLRHQNEKPMTLREATLGTEFPPALERIVAKLLEKDPDRRYQDLFALASDLEVIRRGSDALSETATQVFVRKAAERTEKIDFVPVLIAVFLVITVASVSFMAGRYTVPSQKVKPSINAFDAGVPRADDKKEIAARSASVNDISDTTVKFAAGEGATGQTQYYSNTRIFRFPAKISLGSIYAYSESDKDGEQLPEFLSPDGRILGSGVVRRTSLGAKDIRALGVVVVKNFAPIALRVSPDAMAVPALMNGFRDDEIAELDLQSLDIKNSDLASLARFKGVKRLLLSNTEVNSVAVLDLFPKLTDLQVGFGFYKTQDLARLKRLKDLTSLGASYCGNGKILLRALNNDTNLRTLRMERTELDDSCMDLITAIPNLEKLDIAQNPKVTRKGVAKLTKLKKLKELDLPMNVDSDDTGWIRETFPADLKVNGKKVGIKFH